jgi:phage terminase large subunit
LFCDEPPPRALWISAFRGLRNNPDYFVVLAGTPVSEPWLYEEIYAPGIAKKDPSIEIIQGSTYDNPYLSKTFIEDFKARLSEDEIRVRLNGEFAHLQGRVFKEFTRQTHVFRYQKWPEDWPVYCAIDPHPRKPHTALYLGVTADDVMVVIDELMIEGTVEDLAVAMRQREEAANYRIVCRRIDNSGSGTDWNRDSFITQLDEWSRRHSYNVRVSPMRKREKDVAHSIQKIKVLLKDNRLRFLENCTNTISDMELYAWQDNRHPEASGVLEKPRKIHDDMIDPLRYLIASNPIHSPTLQYISTLGDSTPYNKRI